MISDEFALEVLRALSKADRFGMSLHELACAVWPDRDRDARQHSALGAALAELLERGLVVSSGEKRSRYALSPEGETWLRRYRVTPPAPAARPAPRFAGPTAPQFPPAVEDAIEASLEFSPDWDWLTDSQRRAHVREKVQCIIDACVIEGRFVPAMRDAALAEASRRARAVAQDLRAQA